MNKFMCRNPKCDRFYEELKFPLISAPKCVECSHYTERVRPLFNYPRLIAVLIGGALIGWAMYGSQGIVFGCLGLFVFEVLYGRHDDA